MAGSKPDYLNAALGATFGVVVGPIVDSLIKNLMFVRQCPKECKALAETLDRIQPSLKNIDARYRNDPNLEKWLNAFGKCVENALVVLQKCTVERPSIRGVFNMVFYGREVQELHYRIKELVSEAAFLLLASGSSSCGITQEVPKNIFGMEDYFRRVKFAVCEGHSREGSSCVGIRGTGGAGKTLLAQMVNNNEEIQKVFGKESVIWITVGRDASISKIYDRMRNLLQIRHLGGPLEDQRTDLMNAFARAEALLILEDVWDGCVHETKEMVYWLNIAKGSKCVTLITTRDESITRECVNAGEEIILRLSKEQSWQLFCTHAFGTDTPTLNVELEDMARAVCGKCACLPLALKVIGCAMKGQSDWKRMFDRLQGSAMPNQSIDEQLFGRLRVSYDALDRPTRICFIYFAAFPEDYEVRVKELCQIWVAEGLFGDCFGKKEALAEGDYAVKELVRRSLIEVCKADGGGALKRVKMHDILHDLANQLVNKGNECERDSLFKIEKKGFVEFPHIWLGCEMKVKRLSLWGSNIKRFPDEVLAPDLKICMLHGDIWPSEGLRSLVLGMPDCNIEEKFFEKLHALRFLNICEYGNITQLPESIGGLRSLQHLNLFGCRALKELPKSMGGLESLQYLNLSNCWALKQLPESMGRLGSLQYLNLCKCIALKQLPESMGGLGSLQHLKLCDCIALKQLPENMGGLESLQDLKLTNCWALKQLPESMGGLESLHHLNLYGCKALEQLPQSMGGLESLQHLQLSDCWALKQLPESIGELRSLQDLKLSNCWTLKQLPDSIGRLGSLQHLNLSWCVALEQLPENIGGLGSLQHLNLSKCKALKQLPESIGRLGSLQHLDLLGCRALVQLPMSLGGLRSLKLLKLRKGNSSISLLDFSKLKQLQMLFE